MLGDIARLVRGNGMPKTDLVDEGVGAIHYGQIYTRYGVSAAETISFVTPEAALKLAKAQPGDIIITNTSENVEDVGKAVAWLGSEPIVTGGHATIIKHDFDPKYLSYWFQSESFSVQKRGLATGTKVFDVSARQLAKVRLPVPPIVVQREIVSVLDHFAGAGSGLIEELEAEQEARRSQFQYYRDLLLRPESDCQWLTLREVAGDFGRGKSKHRPRNDPRLYDGPYPFIQTGDVRSSGHRIVGFTQTYSEAGLAQSKLWPRGTICITIAANIAETGVLDFDACFPDSVIGLVVDPERASAGYVEYLLQSLKSTLVAMGKGSAQANINLATFEDIRFPFPSLGEQERITEVLDRFDAMVNDIGGGIPAEIAARRKQYEYYRDRLLTFEELAA